MPIDKDPTQWVESFAQTSLMFDEAGVDYGFIQI